MILMIIHLLKCAADAPSLGDSWVSCWKL